MTSTDETVPGVSSIRYWPHLWRKGDFSTSSDIFHDRLSHPDETGSFYIGFDLDHYVLSPSGEINLDRLETK